MKSFWFWFPKMVEQFQVFKLVQKMYIATKNWFSNFVLIGEIMNMSCDNLRNSLKTNKNSPKLTLCRGYWRGCGEPWIARNSRPKKRALRWAPLVFVEKIHWNFETAKEKCVNKTLIPVQLSSLVCSLLIKMGIQKSSQLHWRT